MPLNPLDWQAAWPVIFGGLWIIVFLRANATYWVGRAALAGATRTRLRRWTSTPGFRRTQELVERWGAPVISVSFLTIGFQTAANLSAGITKMPLRRYLPAVVVGGAAWALIYSTLGLVGWQAVSYAWQRWPNAVIVVVVAVAVGIAGYVIWKRRAPRSRAGTADQPAR